jgi:hypothetical protein
LTVRTIQQAGITPRDLHALYLTGGSSQLRPVTAMLADLLGGRPATLDDPKLVVALGAHYATPPDRRSAIHVGLAHGPAASEADRPAAGRREKSLISDASQSARNVTSSDVVQSPAKRALRQGEASAVRRAVLMCNAALLPANLTLMALLAYETTGADADHLVIPWLSLTLMGVIGSGVWAARTRLDSNGPSRKTVVPVVLLSLVGCAAVILTVLGADSLYHSGVNEVFSPGLTGSALKVQ